MDGKTKGFIEPKGSRQRVRVKTKGFIKPLGEYGFEFARGGEGVGKGEYRVSSLVKQNKKGKICFVIYIAGYFFLKKFCYEVIVKQKKT